MAYGVAAVEEEGAKRSIFELTLIEDVDDVTSFHLIHQMMRMMMKMTSPTSLQSASYL